MTVKFFPKNILPYPLLQTYLPQLTKRFSTIDKHVCTCVITQEKIEKCLKDRKIDAFRLQMRGCHISQSFQKKWDWYQIEARKEPGVSHCKALRVLNIILPRVLSDQSNIKELDPNYPLVESHLSTLSSEPGKVTLAGEGGRHVGRKEYWAPLLDRLKMYKNKPTKILSIGGGIGYESRAIAKVFLEDGYNIQKSLIVDPNRLAAFLCEDEVDYYVTTSQRFFNDFFTRDEEALYLIHLGTTLNVVEEDAAVRILEQIADSMKPKDAVSILMVDKRQFENSNQLSIGSENEHGLSKVIHLSTGKHYKTVITDEDKFANFMTSLGLRGELIKIAENGITLNVAFVAFKALKDED